VDLTGPPAREYGPRPPEPAKAHEQKAIEEARQALVHLATPQLDSDLRAGILGTVWSHLDDATWPLEAGLLTAQEARELIALTHEINQQALQEGDTRFQGVLDHYKKQAYGSTEIQPEIPQSDTIGPAKQPEGVAPDTTGETRRLVSEERDFEWQGAPIRLGAASDQVMAMSDPNMLSGITPKHVITQRLGDHNTWYMQTGDGAPTALEPDAAIMLGRDQLGENQHVSRKHLTVTPHSNGTVNVADHSMWGTLNETPQWPLPEPGDGRVFEHTARHAG
jgi:hypothetical protein